MYRTWARDTRDTWALWGTVSDAVSGLWQAVLGFLHASGLWPGNSFGTFRHLKPPMSIFIKIYNLLEWTRPFHGRVRGKELEDLSNQIRTSFEQIFERACKRMLLETSPLLKVFALNVPHHIFLATSACGNLGLSSALNFVCISNIEVLLLLRMLNNRNSIHVNYEQTHEIQYHI